MTFKAHYETLIMFYDQVLEKKSRKSRLNSKVYGP
jgi:hypothetical protein